MISRRGFLQSILALGVAPYIGRADALMKSPTFGRAIPLIYGTMRVAAPVVWSSDLTETVNRVGPLSQYTYSASFDVAPPGIDDGSILSVLQDVTKLWAGGRLIFDAAVPGVAPFERTPAGLLRFKDCDLTEFGNCIPPIMMQVERCLSNPAKPSCFP